MYSLPILIFCLGVLHAEPATAPVVTLSSRADEVAALFCKQPGGYDALFTPEFRKAVPAARLTKLLTGIFATAGRCTRVTPIEPITKDRGQFTFTFENGAVSTVRLNIEADEPHQVSGLLVGALELSGKSFDDCIAQLKKLPGVTSLFAAEIQASQLKPLAQLNADQPLAIGSTFKLYVLAELVAEIEAGQRHWDDVVHLTEEARSLPSGEMHKWPVGSPLTLHTLASLMISQSDNTAADLLIRTLGREKIEAMLSTAGHSNPKANQPFLTTLEMFKLKGDPAHKAIDVYLADSIGQRRAMLDGPIAKMPQNKLDFPSTPSHISDIEWFASTTDLAKAMLWLKTHSERQPTTEARGVLSINPGLDLAKQNWSFIGYKGGSEPGVVNMTYLLQKADRWFVVSVTWNNQEHVLEESNFYSIVHQAVGLTGKE